MISTIKNNKNFWKRRSKEKPKGFRSTKKNFWEIRRRERKNKLKLKQRKNRGNKKKRKRKNRKKKKKKISPSLLLSLKLRKKLLNQRKPQDLNQEKENLSQHLKKHQVKKQKKLQILSKPQKFQKQSHLLPRKLSLLRKMQRKGRKKENLKHKWRDKLKKK